MISCIKILHFSGIILVLIYILICLVYSLLTWRPDTTESNSMRDSDADESQVNFEIIRKSFIDHTQFFKVLQSLLMYVNILNFFRMLSLWTAIKTIEP